jgi:hypothetical protein
MSVGAVSLKGHGISHCKYIVKQLVFADCMQPTWVHLVVRVSYSRLVLALLKELRSCPCCSVRHAHHPPIHTCVFARIEGKQCRPHFAVGHGSYTEYCANWHDIVTCTCHAFQGTRSAGSTVADGASLYAVCFHVEYWSCLGSRPRLHCWLCTKVVLVL